MARVTFTLQGAARTAELGPNLVVVGADPSCTIRLDGATDSAGVSPVHCELRRSLEGWRVVDLESRAGTKVNGEFVNTRALRSGDVIDVGGVELRFDDAEATVASAATSAGASPGTPVASPLRRSHPKPLVSQRTAARAAPAVAAADEASPAERRRRIAKKADGLTIAMYVGAGVLGLFLVGFLLLKAVSSETHNHGVRVQMLAAESRMDWKRVLELEREAVPEPSFDRTEIQAAGDRARKAVAAIATGHRIEESVLDWRWLRVWRQENRTDDAAYVEKIDEYLRKYPGMDSEGLKQARAERVKVAGTAAIGGVIEPGEPGWKTLLVDVQAMEVEGRFGPAMKKIDGWWAANRDLAPTLVTAVDAEKARLTGAAEKWFAKQVALAIHYVGNGERKKAQRTIEQAAESIDLPGFRERVPAEVTRVLSDTK